MTEGMGALLGEMRQTKERIKEGTCSRHMEAWGAFSEVARGEGALSAKHKALIGLAIGLSKQCAQCVAYHAEAAFSQGATSDEVMEAAFVAVLMEGGPAQAHLSLVLQAIEEFGRP